MIYALAVFSVHWIWQASASASYRCVFIHGSGVKDTQPADTNDTMGYWGGLEHISKYTPYCASRHFLHQNTAKRGWDDGEVLKATCDLAVGEASGGSIRDTVVISHSMGNLIFAQALRQNLCSFDAGTSKWLSLEAPWWGSEACDVLKHLCSNTTSQRLWQWIAKKAHYCDPDVPGEVNLGYKTMSPEYPALQGLVEIAERYVHKAICGSSAFGLTSKYSAALDAIAHEVRYGAPNDGMVRVDSCKLPGRQYESHHSAPFYLAEINHADGTCREGDSKKAQPCAWLSLAVDETNTSQTVLV